jgi:outer membrane protein OmpA-like peptidoglycan-associated protein
MFAPELIASRAFGAIRLSTNLGYRARPQAELAGLVIDDELLARIGAGYRLGERGGPPLELDLTVSAATSASDPFSAFNLDALEVVGGASYQINRALQGVAAAGLGIQEGFGTPDWRLVLGVRYQRGGDRDYDGDGLVGAADRCPHEAEDVDGFEDSNGCPDPDNDGDGVPDVADGAPMEAEDKDGYEDGDGVPDPDNDNDGVLDVADACPLEAEDMDGFEDGNGCPDPDNDNDGVLDVADGCPLESGVADNQGCPDTDRDGDTVVDRLDQCPDEPGEVDRNGCAATVEVKGDIIVFGKVHFNTSEAVILPRSHRVLDEAAKAIRERPELGKIQVEGHTDDRGDNFFNRSLSQRRAQAVVDYLVGKGVSRARLIPKGFGPMVPLQPNTSDENRAVNRRVELRIIGN